MASIKSLAKDTAVYGLSSIIGRFLNWLLVPLYTIKFAEAEYGVVTYVYAIVALALVVLTYGMETGFFRFANHERWKDPNEVYSTTMTSVGVTSLIFMVLVWLFIDPVSDAMECGEHHDYVLIMAATVAIDAFSCIPFSRLRYQKRPMRFAALKLISIGVNITLNIFFILICPYLWEEAPGVIYWFYDPDYGIGYIFLANLISTLFTLLLLTPDLTGFRWRFSLKLWREMIAYSFPLLIMSLAGIMNQTIDKILLPWLVTDKEDAMAQVGVYGANYKIAIVMVMFIQAFRFAYEPFIFSQHKEETSGSNGKGYSQFSVAMLYFVIFSMVIFLGVTFYLDILKYFIGERYFSGLKVVPIILMAEFFFGVFFNLSVWYKLTDKTIWGTWFSLIGLTVTVTLNCVLVPHIGYMGCAIAALCCYGVMMVLSYVIGQRYLAINYQAGRLLVYLLVAVALYAIAMLLTTPSEFLNLTLRTIMLAGFILWAAHRENLTIKTVVPSGLLKKFKIKTT
ncbi:MAG: polysaccharide biosynthesis protein [Paramuribaculum sp.]|nr:polysaccharide biosynthesis protein [Paramuribaculum sp.]